MLHVAGWGMVQQLDPKTLRLYMFRILRGLYAQTHPSATSKRTSECEYNMFPSSPFRGPPGGFALDPRSLRHLCPLLHDAIVEIHVCLIAILLGLHWAELEARAL